MNSGTQVLTLQLSISELLLNNLLCEIILNRLFDPKCSKSTDLTDLIDASSFEVVDISNSLSS